jgi:hypothetical protein
MTTFFRSLSQIIFIMVHTMNKVYEINLLYNFLKIQESFIEALA